MTGSFSFQELVSPGRLAESPILRASELIRRTLASCMLVDCNQGEREMLDAVISNYSRGPGKSKPRPAMEQVAIAYRSPDAKITDVIFLDNQSAELLKAQRVVTHAGLGAWKYRYFWDAALGGTGDFRDLSPDLMARFDYDVWQASDHLPAAEANPMLDTQLDAFMAFVLSCSRRDVGSLYELR